MSRPPQILVYGFGPYREFKDNITARIVRRLRPQSGLKKTIFPVRFHRKQFVDSIQRYKPEIIVGLGQSSRRRIQIETRARNWRRTSGEAAGMKITRTGPTTIKTTLPLKAAGHAGHSANAGDYVCNFSMYVMLEEIRRTAPTTRYGFIHIPYDFDEDTAGAWVEGILRSIRSALLKKTVSS